MLRDRDIREPLFEYLEETYDKIRIIEEKTMGKSRADVVMISPEIIYGIEIKSDADTYSRLASQVKDYDKYYDMNYVVVGTSHAHHIREHVPEYWGVITVELVDGVFDFYTLREPALNPKITLKKKLEILWRPELVQVQEKFSMPKYKEKSKAFVISKISEYVTKEKIEGAALQQYICQLLFERDYNTIEEDIALYRKGKKRRRKRLY